MQSSSASAIGACQKLLDLSVVLVASQKSSGLEAMLTSLCPHCPYCQYCLSCECYEIIVVDRNPAKEEELSLHGTLPSKIRALKTNVDSMGPAAAFNQGLAKARGKMVLAMMGDAQGVTPRLISTLKMVSARHESTIVLCPSFSLEQEPEYWTYEREEDAYRLFDLCSFSNSWKNELFYPVGDGHSIAMPLKMWSELDGYDTVFKSRGGGIANFDLLVRALSLPGAQLAVLRGEGSFHQGPATGA